MSLALSLVTLPFTNLTTAKVLSDWIKSSGMAENSVTRSFTELKNLLGRGIEVKELYDDVRHRV